MMIPCPTEGQHVTRVDKLWGREHWIHNGEYCGKLLALTPAMTCSLHAHPVKDETFWVLFGECWIQVGDQFRKLYPGHFQHIPPGTPHRFFIPPDMNSGIDNSVCMIAEFSTHHDDGDVIRYEESGPCKLLERELTKKARSTMLTSPSECTPRTECKNIVSATRGSLSGGRRSSPRSPRRESSSSDVGRETSRDRSPRRRR